MNRGVLVKWRFGAWDSDGRKQSLKGVRRSSYMHSARILVP